jgi:choline transport protein
MYLRCFYHRYVPLLGPVIPQIELRLTHSLPAFNALIGSSVVLQQISFLIPVVLLVYRKRSPQYLPKGRAFTLPSAIGWTANIIVIIFATVTLVFFNFPAFLPTSAGTMSELSRA